VLARRAGQAPLDLPAPATRTDPAGPAIRRLVLAMARDNPVWYTDAFDAVFTAAGIGVITTARPGGAGTAGA
jgi:hypothetical protein